jgi:hypothetical protein
VAETDLGEIPNWRTLVDDLRHGLLDEVLDYLMEPRYVQFIVGLSGGRGIGQRRAAVRERRGHWRARLVSITVASSPAITGCA